MLRAHMARRFFATSTSSTASTVSHAVSSATASTSETSTRAATRAAASSGTTGHGRASAPSAKPHLTAFDKLPAKVSHTYMHPSQPPLFDLKQEMPQLAGLAVFGAFVVFCILASPSTSKREAHH